MTTETKCPFDPAVSGGPSNRDWWPNVRDFVAAWSKVMNLDRFDLG